MKIELFHILLLFVPVLAFIIGTLIGRFLNWATMTYAIKTYKPKRVEPPRRFNARNYLYGTGPAFTSEEVKHDPSHRHDDT